MSQSTTYYRISKDAFNKLEASGGNSFDLSSAKNYVSLQGSFMGLEFVLSKDQEDATVKQVQELFNPQQSLGGRDIDLDDPESFEEFDFEDLPINYLNPTSIGSIHNVLDKISTTEIENLYDADELNSNGIYPEIWHNDNSQDKAYNLLQLQEDLTELKAIIKQATEEGDYILVYGG